MPDPFPNELVEAAAKALYDAEDLLPDLLGMDRGPR